MREGYFKYLEMLFGPGFTRIDTNIFQKIYNSVYLQLSSNILVEKMPQKAYIYVQEFQSFVIINTLLNLLKVKTRRMCNEYDNETN